MKWANRYEAPTRTLWQGRPDSPDNACLFQLIKLIDLNRETLTPQQNIAFGLIGFCCDEGIKRNLGRPGAAEGPNKLREWLAKLPIQKPITCFDFGNITCKDQDLESAQAALGEAVTLLLKNNITPIVLGGGHELAFGHYQGISAFTHLKLGKKLGIVNFDAHFDMRPLAKNQGNSGTPFLQIAKDLEAKQQPFDYSCIGIQRAGNTQSLFDTATKYHVHSLLADDLHQSHIDKCHKFVDRIIAENQILYLTLCLDVFAAAYAPGVSAPQSLGLTPWQVLPYIRQLASSGKVISYDIAELSPPFDKDNRTAKLAAQFIFEILHHHHHKIASVQP